VGVVVFLRVEPTSRILYTTTYLKLYAYRCHIGYILMPYPIHNDLTEIWSGSTTSTEYEKKLELVFSRKMHYSMDIEGELVCTGRFGLRSSSVDYYVDGYLNHTLRYDVEGTKYTILSKNSQSFASNNTNWVYAYASVYDWVDNVTIPKGATLEYVLSLYIKVDAGGEGQGLISFDPYNDEAIVLIPLRG